MTEFVLASSNFHKQKEISRLFPRINVLIPNDLGLDFDFEEKGSSFFENALSKAVNLYKLVCRPVLADDSGLVIPGLGGEPGIYSARYGSKDKGGNLSDKQRNSFLLNRMKNVTDRKCFFVCCMVLIMEEYRFFTAQETVTGELAYAPCGTSGFGYDPLFYLPDIKKTVAELSDEEKDRISHRGKAARRISNLLIDV